jgi:hypothetical protein
MYTYCNMVGDWSSGVINRYDPSGLVLPSTPYIPAPLVPQPITSWPIEKLIEFIDMLDRIKRLEDQLGVAMLKERIAALEEEVANRKKTDG